MEAELTREEKLATLDEWEEAGVLPADEIARMRKHVDFKLIPDWCSEEHDDTNGYHSYPKYNQCKCGMVKEHVHCMHGGIVQIG